MLPNTSNTGHSRFTFVHGFQYQNMQVRDRTEESIPRPKNFQSSVTLSNDLTFGFKRRELRP